MEGGTVETRPLCQDVKPGICDGVNLVFELSMFMETDINIIQHNNLDQGLDLAALSQNFCE
jgi:hypothetical protein